jgi:hypothetical protein
MESEIATIKKDQSSPIISNVMSSHTPKGTARWGLQAQNLAPWCRLPGSPFFGNFFLMPNHPNSDKVLVTFGPFKLRYDIDSFSYFVSSKASKSHNNTLNVDLGILGDSGNYFNHSRLCLSYKESKATTISFNSQESKSLYLTFGVSFQDFYEGSAYGGIEIKYMIGFKQNPLIELFNQMGSDKGTECGFGTNGVPHCYAVEYHRLFLPLPDRQFNFLEIGLDNGSKTSGLPQDAPSLRAWRKFFPKANLYGYDINDFSFFDQEKTFTFQGDQSSREDIKRFLEKFEEPQFEVILDDGSHASSHQQISLATLFRNVAPGGMYIVEDLGWQPFDESPKTLEFLRRYCENGKIESPFISELEAQYLEEAISNVEIYKPNDSEFAVIYKKKF